MERYALYRMELFSVTLNDHNLYPKLPHFRHKPVLCENG